MIFFRTITYFAIWVALWTVGGVMLIGKQDLRLQMLRPPGSSFTFSEESGVVSNHFAVKAVNKSADLYELTIHAPEGYEVVSAFRPWLVEPQQTEENQVFIRKSRAHFDPRGKEKVKVTFRNRGELVHQTEITIVGPQS